MIGTVLGNRYEILEEIGCGGMANVYKAHCKLLNRMVAIKVLKKELEEDTEYLKRFNVEAQAAASLVHPNIVSIFDFGYDEGYHYIVMEMIDGITLKQYINERAPLDTKDALGIAYQICDALSAAHQNNIVHRDIKPHNIMITSDHRVKVTDFGIARATVGSTMTADTNILGSVHYISPEQARGSVVDGRTDLYSLGVVLYEMLTGRVPYHSDAPVAVAMMHIEQKPVSPREYNPELTPSVEKLIFKALSKHIGDRYQTGAEFNSDIMKLLENPDAEIAVADIQDEDMDSTRKIPVVTGGDAVSDKPHDKTPAEIMQEKRKARADAAALNRENKRILIGAIITALLIVGLLSLGVTYVLYPEAPIFSMFASDKVEVPDFYGKTLDEAQEMAEQNELVIEVKDEVVDNSVDEGCILDQSPNSGRSVEKGTVIRVTICIGEEKIRVNNYKLTNGENAKEDLENEGFTVELEEEFSDEVPEGYVIRHDPEEGEEAPKGSKVTLVISKGPEDTTFIMPNFVGKTLEQAQNIITSSGLILGDISYEKSVVDKGTVIRQNISGGETVGKQTPISLVVSKGDEKVEEQKPDNSTTNEPKTKKLTQAINTTKNDVSVRVLEDGNQIFDGLGFPPEFSLDVKGTGKKTYEIYIDGSLVATKTINFDE